MSMCCGDGAACGVRGWRSWAARQKDCEQQRKGIEDSEKLRSFTDEKVAGQALAAGLAKVAGSCYARLEVLTALAPNTWAAWFTNAAPACVGVGTKNALPLWCRAVKWFLLRVMA